MANRMGDKLTMISGCGVVCRNKIEVQSLSDVLCSQLGWDGKKLKLNCWKLKSLMGNLWH